MGELRGKSQREPLEKATAALDEALDLMTKACGDLIEARRDDLVVRIDGAYGLIANVVKDAERDG